MRFRGDAPAHVSVLETAIVGLLMLGAIVYFVQVGEPRSDEGAASGRVEVYATDALTVLSQLPSTEGNYASLLDELVDQAYDGNSAPLKTRLDRYFPPGVSYNVYLDEGGDLTPLIAPYEPTGPTVSVTRLVNKVDGLYLLFPQVENVPGTMESDLLTYYGIPLRNGFYYPHLPSALEFPNGHVVPFEPDSEKGVLVARAVPPHLVDAPDGYATQYDKTDNVTFATSLTTAAAGPQVEYSVTTNTDYTIGGLPSYKVHPDNIFPTTVASTLDSADFVDTSADKKSATRGGKVTMRYNYGWLAATSWVVSAQEVNIYDPKTGVKIHREDLSNLKGTLMYPVPKNAPYGTYVCEFQFTLVKGTSTQVVRDLTMFHVTSSTVMEPLPPVYRLELVAWFEGA